jgi:hypothetical protein
MTGSPVAPSALEMELAKPNMPNPPPMVRSASRLVCGDRKLMPLSFLIHKH